MATSRPTDGCGGAIDRAERTFADPLTHLVGAQPRRHSSTGRRHLAGDDLLLQGAHLLGGVEARLLGE